MLDSMTLLDAKPYDDTRDRRRLIVIVAAVFLVAIGGWLIYHFRNYGERHTALEKQDFQSAYAIWFRDPEWKQHPDAYKSYPFNDFYRDWGPGGEWGLIKSYSVDCSIGPGNGVIVQVTVNHRLEHAFVWVDKDDKKLSFSPNEIQCGNWWGWLTE
jgi:hypothetical protein